MRKYQRGFWQFAIPAIASVAAGALGAKGAKDSAEENRRLQEDANAQNLAAQKEFAQHGVSWRVADAKAAGLHPLYALSGSGATFSPSFRAGESKPATDYSWLAQLGQLMGNYLGGDKEAVAQSRMREAQRSEGSQSVTITEYPGGGRTIVTPLAGLESQVSGVPLDAPMSLVESPGVNQFSGGVYQRPLSDPRAKAHVSSAENAPFWQRFAFGPGGFSVILPKTSEPQEVFEDKPLWFWAMVAKANVTEYGMGWLSQARQQFPSLRQVYDGVVQELKSSGLWWK